MLQFQTQPTWMSGLPADLDEIAQGRIRAEQMHAITRATPMMTAASVCAACVLLVSFLGDMREPAAIAWTFIVCAVSAFYYVSSLGPRRRMRAMQASQESALSAIRRAFFLGSLWAVLPAAFITSFEPDTQLTIFCLCCGMMGGGAFFLSPLPGAALAFFTPLLATSAFAVFRIDTTEKISLVALFGVYGLALARMSQVHARHWVERIVNQIEAERRSGRDLATGLPNRELFSKEMSVAFQRLNRFGQKFALVRLHVENFDMTGGANANDEETAIAALARRIVGLVDATDVVGRIDDREFAVILTGVGCPQDAAAVVDRLAKSLGLPLQIHDDARVVHWSIGIAMAPIDGADVVTLMRAVSSACAAARASADHTSRFFNSADEELVAERRALEEDLCSAVARRQLHLEFQPILDLGTQRIVSCEALVRWRHPERGIVAPDVFIPIAERTGLIHEIGEWIVEDACRVLSKLPADMHMAMNISAAQLRGDSVLSTLEHALAGSGVSYERIDIEVTESLLISRDDPALAVIAQLSDAGFAITLDDFGTGYASLNYLGRLPLKRVKIDREFVAAMVREPRHLAIVQSILQLSKALDLKVTAEGVETQAQFDVLKALGCDSAQGYLIARPLPERELLAMLADNQTLMAAA